MSETSVPRPYTDKELTLRAISLTFQRAKAAQQELSGAANAQPGETAEGSDTAELADGEQLSHPLDEPEQLDLPNPIVTDANLHHYLEQATIHQTDVDAERARSRVESLRSIAAARATQARFNDAALNAIHQLDHRTRLQQQTITRLEAELADARRALAALESGEDGFR